MHHAILRHGARCFFLACGEDGDEGLDQVMGTKDEHSTILQKPCVFTTRASIGSGFQRDKLMFAREHFRIRQLELYIQ
jgi:hypothetical protein